MSDIKRSAVRKSIRRYRRDLVTMMESNIARALKDQKYDPDNVTVRMAVEGADSAMENAIVELVDAAVAAERARVAAFCDNAETEAMNQGAKETGYYNDARYYDGRASAFRAVMTMLEDTTATGGGE